MNTRPTPGTVEERTAAYAPAPAVDGRRLHGLIPYSVESRDLGGFTEIIEPGALVGADLTDLIATREHDRSKLLGRHPTTLSVENRADAFAWSVDLPQSPVGEDVRVAVERGDLRSTSWRMVVGTDRWDGNVRHVTKIAELRDVTVTASPAYGDAAVAEYRSTEISDKAATAANTNPGKAQEAVMGTEPEQTDEAATAEDRTEPATTTSTATSTTASTTTPTDGSLRVADRVTVGETRSLAEAFRRAGFPGETATIDYGEFRAVTWSGAADDISHQRQNGVNLGADQRYAYPAFPQVSVSPGDTAVQVLTQTARTLAAASDVLRAVDAVTAKPETSSTLDVVTTSLKQVATIQSNIPNIYLEQPAFNTVIENDLRLALNEGLDKLVLDAVAASGFQDPSTDPLLVSIRKSITTLQGNGYNADTLVLTPSDAETLDTLRATARPARSTTCSPRRSSPRGRSLA